MPEYCCHVLGADEADQATELFHVHVEAPMPELAVPLVFIQAARKNIDLGKAAAITLEFVYPVEDDARKAYEALRQHLNTGTPAQSANPDPTQGPSCTVH